MKCWLCFTWIENFAPLAGSPLLPVEPLQTWPKVQKLLDGSWHQPQSAPCEVLKSTCKHPLLLFDSALFLPQFSLPLSFPLMVFDGAVLAVTFCGLASFRRSGLSMIIFLNGQFSSVPCDCGFPYKTRKRCSRSELFESLLIILETNN